MKTIVTLLTMLLIGSRIMAAPLITAKTTNGDWSSAASWDLNRVPADNDTIVIPANMTIRMTKPRSLNHVIIKVYGTFFFDGGKLNLDGSSRFLLETGGRVSGSEFAEHLTIGNIVKFLGNETPVTGLSYADQTTGVSPQGFQRSASLLPVTFMNFYARRANQHIALSWATAQESNNDRFELERSYNGQQWTMIAMVFGAGNSNVVNNYSYTDKNIAQSIVYYRIRQVDYDGRSQYSAVKVVKHTAGRTMTEIYVAAAQTVAVQLPQEMEGNLAVKVFNMNGQVVAQQSYSNAAYQVSIGVNSTVKGVHIVQVTNGNNWKEVKKIVL